MATKFRYIRRIFIHIALMVVVAVLIVFATFKWIHSFTNHGEHVEVPLVEGLISDEAMVVLKNNMLQGEITEYRYQSNLEVENIFFVHHLLILQAVMVHPAEQF